MTTITAARKEKLMNGIMHMKIVFCYWLQVRSQLVLGFLDDEELAVPSLLVESSYHSHNQLTTAAFADSELKDALPTPSLCL